MVEIQKTQSLMYVSAFICNPFANANYNSEKKRREKNILDSEIHIYLYIQTQTHTQTYSHSWCGEKKKWNLEWNSVSKAKNQAVRLLLLFTISLLCFVQ